MENNSGNSSFRIDERARVQILADFWPAETDAIVQKVQSFKDEHFRHNAAALCLYAGLLVSNIHEDNVQLLNPNYASRAADGRTSLPQKPKYAGLSKKDLEAAIKEICLRDTRNCFSHGNFEILAKDQVEKSYFVLMPNQSPIVSNGKIMVPFANVHRALENYQRQQTMQAMANGIKQSAQNNPEEMIEKVIIPSALLSLANYYMYGQSPSMQGTLTSPKFSIYLQNVFLATMLSYNQSFYHNLFGADSEIFKAIGLIRNSLMHNLTKFSDGGKKQILQDQYKGKNTFVEGDLHEISLKMEILNSAKDKIAAQIIESGTGVNLIEQQVALNDLLAMLEGSFALQYGKDFEDLAKEK